MRRSSASDSRMPTAAKTRALFLPRGWKGFNQCTESLRGSTIARSPLGNFMQAARLQFARDLALAGVKGQRYPRSAHRLLGWRPRGWSGTGGGDGKGRKDLTDHGSLGMGNRGNS